MQMPQTSQIHAQAEEEVSLLDIILFLKRAYKTLAITAVLGLVIASIFLLVSPNQYEALANIVMARDLPTDKNPLGVNIEEPQSLIHRMSLPISLVEQVQGACHLQSASNPAAQLSKVIKLTIPRGVADVVELKVIRSSPEVAKACANSVFEAIRASQTQIIEQTVQQIKAAKVARVAKVEERLAQDKTLLAKAGDSKNTVSPTYFALLSEIRALEDEREMLLTTVNTGTVQAARLQSPVYVADQPIYPKKALSLVAGLMGGLFLGIVIALARRSCLNLKPN